MSVVIEAQNISKRFFLGERNQRAFFEDVAVRAMAGFRRLLHRGKVPPEANSRRDFWALRDVSFQLSSGHTLGIIGENGAGKSTLLKILSRITQPTTGTVKVYGRLASLLEIGTGFHPEFSGRDNIYLNGAMLGLSRREVRDRFDRIVDFSGLERFIEVPVKNYSSGMYIRLAFSVAAHLNPEIVILDEVLAVGDAVFQKKCFDRMEEIINEGHAAILVSHAMPHLRRLSQFCLWLKHGRIEMFGPTHEVVSEYEKRTAHEVASLNEKQMAQQPESAAAEPRARLSGWIVEGRCTTGPHTLIASQERVMFRLEIELTTDVVEGSVAISIADFQGSILFTQEQRLNQIAAGKLVLVLDLQSLPVRPGEYIISCTISENDHPIAFLRGTPELSVLEEKASKESGYHGILHIPANLSVEQAVGFECSAERVLDLTPDRES
jgi:ABC-type polysaccharide/polyol phosphate transport system ATPase subunit